MGTEFIIEREGKKFVSFEKILPEFTILGRPVVKENNGEKLLVYVPHGKGHMGHGSKKIILPKEVELRACLV